MRESHSTKAVIAESAAEQAGECTQSEQDPDTPILPTQPTAKEIGGRRSGLEPTRYGDWEKNGRCIDF